MASAALLPPSALTSPGKAFLQHRFLKHKSINASSQGSSHSGVHGDSLGTSKWTEVPRSPPHTSSSAPSLALPGPQLQPV